MAKFGTIITTPDGPSVSSFSFVIQSGNVKKGQFVSVKTEEGVLIGTIKNIYKTNRYFESAGAVREYDKAGELYSAFPVKEWEYTIAETKALGVYGKDGLLNRPSFPPSPGMVVTDIDPKLLNKFLGLDQERGLDLGTVQQQKLRAKFNLTKMLQKHMAILAISGAGKSYATSVLIEELLSRSPKQGRVALLVIDNHGEYIGFEKDPKLKNKVQVIDGDDIKIAANRLSEKGIAAMLPRMSAVQVRDLGKIISYLREEKEAYSISDIINALKEDENISKATKEALVGWLSELQSMRLFSTSEWPNIENMMRQGHMVVINLKKILNLKKKQIIVNHLSRKLFNLRKQGIVPPYLEIIEEAHNFCPEGKRAEAALSRGIIELLAREGRKFYANLCLISQRPIQLSTTALSQCNTQMVLKVTNPYDLDHIAKSSESITRSTLDMISTLKVGEALMVGEATNYPVFIKVRKRRTKESHGKKLEDFAILYEKKLGSKLAKGEDFL
ncbi:DUF87 domain-containing protein [Candidatus Woesearchaeota archaeon]|nr:DUF87 domain-containing protein [Candidatus Woesearchaeota archaeon]